MVLRLGVSIIMLVGLGWCTVLAGCNKSSESNAGTLVAVALSGADLNAEGTIKNEAIQKLDQAGSGNLSVTFVRAPLSDAGLSQLAKFRNLRRVEAIGSRVTQAGIDKLKHDVPEVEVVK